MEPESDTQIIKLHTKDEIFGNIDNDSEEEERQSVDSIDNRRIESLDGERHYALYIKVTVENGENYHDWIYSTTLEVPDEMIRHEFVKKENIMIEFPFSDPMRIPRHTHVRAVAYWKNSEGERSDETIIYYEPHVVDEEEQKMFVRVDRNSAFVNRGIEQDSVSVPELDQELKKMRDALIREHLDIFAPEKEQQLVTNKIRQTLLEFERKYRQKHGIETKHKLETDEETLPQSKEPKPDVEELPDDEGETQEKQQFAVLYKPLLQNDSGAFITTEIFCDLNIELLFRNQFKELWRHYSHVTKSKENKDIEFLK